MQKTLTNYIYISFDSIDKFVVNMTKYTYWGAGSPSASHSIMKGLSFSSALDFTWNSSSSVGGSLIIRGGLCTVN